jgi:3-hydroxyisobutyrate dehydrogenase-like beta-hydroxyacid dehydrogenase
MTESAIGSPMLKARVPLVLDKPNETWFDIELMHKDIRLARQAGDEHGTPLPSAAVADEILTRADQLGYGPRDIAAVHEVLARLSAASVAAR